MAVTVSVENYSLIDACDLETNWTGENPVDQTGFYKENSACVGFTCRGSGDNDMYVTGTFDLSGASHFHMWFMTVVIAEFNYIQLYLSDGTNTGYWDMLHPNDYPGGWYNLVCDYTRTPDAGTAPTLSSITTVGIRFNQTGNAKNAENTWFDHLYVGDGLIAYGDDAGSSFDLEDIFGIDDDDTTSGRGWGMMTKFGGVYYMVGNLTLGDASSTNDVDFQALNQVLIFEERLYNATTQLLDAILYELKCVGNATAVQNDIYFGDVSGGKGISGCTIKAIDSDRPFKITAIDTDLDNFGLYATTFDQYNTVDLAPYNANYEVLGCSFVNSAQQIQPNTMTFKDNFIISGTHTGGSLLFESTSHNISYNNLINCSRATEFTAAGTYSMTGDQFTGNTYDVHFSAASGDLIINAGGTPAANPDSGKVLNDSTGSVTINNTVSLSIHVQDEDNVAIQGAQVYIQKSSPTTYYSHATNNSVGDITFETSAAVSSDMPSAGLLIVKAIDEKKYHWYRYASRTSTVFTFPTQVTGSCTSEGTATQLIDSAADFGGTEDVREGDIIRNTSTGEWAQVDEIVSTTELKTTPLSSGVWGNGNTYETNELVQNYDSSDEVRIPLMNEDTDASGDATEDYNYPGSQQSIVLRVRKSEPNGTRYEDYDTVGTIGSGGYSQTVVMTIDPNA